MSNPPKREVPPGRPTRVVRAVLALLFLAGVGAGVLLATRGDPDPFAGPAPAGPDDREPDAALATDLAARVAVDTVRRETLVLEVSATGQIAADRRAAVVSGLAGRVLDVAVQESGAVVAGWTLVAIDPREAALAVEAAAAELEEARARYREATLFDDRIEDPAVREARERAVRARSGLDGAEIALRRARLDLESATVAAPFAGRVADVRVTAGEHVERGRELMTIVDLDPARVEVRVPEAEIRHLGVGAGATARLPAFPGMARPGRIVSINPIVDPESRTARVRVEIPNPDGRILPGMYARVSLEGRALVGRVTIPRRAIVEREGRTLAFVFEPDGDGTGRAKWVWVTTGHASGDRVEVVGTDPDDGFAPGSLVLVGGHETLAHDAPVRIDPGDP